MTGIGIDYPKPATIGADRLANAIAAHARFGAPVVVVDFGTAVTFDVVDAAANYTGGIIAPGLSAMTDYLHEKTALLPRIKIAEPESVVGKNTRGAMLSGAVHGYRGLIAELVRQLKRELGYAADRAKLPVVASRLTLEGLRLAGLRAVRLMAALESLPNFGLSGACEPFARLLSITPTSFAEGLTALARSGRDCRLPVRRGGGLELDRLGTDVPDRRT